jgi:hypothetical protein
MGNLRLGGYISLIKQHSGPEWLPLRIFDLPPRLKIRVKLQSPLLAFPIAFKIHSCSLKNTHLTLLYFQTKTSIILIFPPQHPKPPREGEQKRKSIFGGDGRAADGNLTGKVGLFPSRSRQEREARKCPERPGIPVKSYQERNGQA